MKFLMVSPMTFSVWNFRGDLLRAIIAGGHEVVVLAPEPDDDGRVAALGARFIHLPFQRDNISPRQDLALLRRLYKIMRAEKPDIVFSYAIKPVIYGSLAARLAGVKRIYSLVPGVGHLFNSRGGRASFVRALLFPLYRLAFGGNRRVFFQNPDNQGEFVHRRFLKARACVLVNGSGVHLTRFPVCPLPAEHRVIMVARILHDKGVREYIEAARLVRTRRPDVIFSFLGPYDTNPAAIQPEEFTAWIADGCVEYLGATDDVRPYLAAARIFALPSYHEGTPRSALEAMATGRPVITTDAPGCREVVIPGQTGLLVPVGDARALADAVLRLVEDPGLCADMARAARTLAEEKYDVTRVNAVLLGAMELP